MGQTLLGALLVVFSSVEFLPPYRKLRYDVEMIRWLDSGIFGAMTILSIGFLFYRVIQTGFSKNSTWILLILYLTFLIAKAASVLALTH